MKSHSIRVRLAAWYTALTTLALIAAGAGTWWLLKQSVQVAADRRLAVHFDGLASFLDGLEPDLTTDETRDEFREYADLSLGDALLQVTDEHGAVLSEPKLADWPTTVARFSQSSSSRQRLYGDVRLDARPFRLASGPVFARGETFQAIVAAPVGPADDALDRARRWLLLSLPVILGLSAAVGFIVSGRALAPVDRMTRAADAITLRNLDRRLDVPAADDELRRLAMTFNSMLGRLQLSVVEMARLTADASHELRTPVSIIRTGAELALRRERSVAEYQQTLTDIQAQAERMTRLVDDLLALARSDAGHEPRASAPVDAGAVVLAAIADARLLAARGGITMATEIAAAPLINGDAEALRTLVAILIDNAIKYMPAGGGSMTARVRAADGAGSPNAVVIEIEDDGAGMGAGDDALVFERFYRGVRARAMADGSGLGLAIARSIVERHGGAIAATVPHPERSDRPGCRIEVVIPAGSEAAKRS